MPRFHKISIDVEEVAVGAVMRLLHNIDGIVNIHYSMDDIGYKQTKKPNGEGRPHGSKGKPRRGYKESGQDVITKLLSKSAPLRTSQLRQAFADAGRGNSIASVIHTMRNDGLVETTPAGYVLTKKMKDRLRH